MRGFAQADRAE